MNDLKFISKDDMKNYISRELENNNYYYTNKVKFNDNDIVIDIGANIGLFSIYLANKYPNIKILSFEPFKENYECLLENIKLNNMTNITPLNKFVANKSNIEINMRGTIKNLGGSEIMKTTTTDEKNIISNSISISLDDIIQDNKIKFLKIDCEGSEYSILYNSKKLNQIESLGGEFHTTHRNKNIMFTPTFLFNYLKSYINNIYYEPVYMSEETESLIMELV